MAKHVKANLPVYLVSLDQDIVRREKLKERFPENYESFRHIRAVDGRALLARDYFNKIKDFHRRYKRMMTPAELGCTLSHIKALTEFLSSDHPHALIVEDDIIGSDDDFEVISEFVGSVFYEGIAFCGCQDGLLLRYKYGMPISSHVFKIAHSNRGEFSRTAAYIVSRNAAKTILEFHNEKFFTVADFWFDLLKDLKGDIYYLSVLSHPTDLSDSNIEKDRVIVSRSLAEKIFSKDVFVLIVNRLRKEAKRAWYKMKGHVQIRDSA